MTYSFDWATRWGYLIIPAICIFGFLTNLTNIAVLLNPKMKDISFKYILATSISDLIYLILESYSFFVLCTDCPLHNTYFTQFYDFIIFHYIIPCMAVFCILTDITLSLIRYSVLKNKNYIQSKNFYLVIGFLLVLSFLFYSPVLFFKKIIPIQLINLTEITLTTDYTQEKTNLGFTLYATITPILLQTIRGLLAMFVLTGINIMNVIEFRKRYSKRIQNQFIHLNQCK
jgi:hypothetical protein